MSTPDRVTREREARWPETCPLCSHDFGRDAVVFDLATHVAVRHADEMKAWLAALSTQEEAGADDWERQAEREKEALEAALTLVKDAGFEPVNAGWLAEIRERLAPQVAQPDEQWPMMQRDPSAPRVVHSGQGCSCEVTSYLGERAIDKTDPMCPVHGPPPVAGSRETEAPCLCQEDRSKPGWPTVPFADCPAHGWSERAVKWRVDRWAATEKGKAQIARLRAHAPGTGEASEDGEAVWIGYRCNDCFQPWTDDHVRHGEREPVELVLRAPGTGGEEAWEHPLDKELPEHVRPAWAVVREAAGESPLFSGTVSSALGVLRKALRAPSEGTREED